MTEAALTARFANEAEQQHWDDLIAANPGGGEVWAGLEYAQAKTFNGYAPRFVLGDSLPATLVLEKQVPLIGKLWYLPTGPAGDDAGDVLAAADAIATLARAQGAFMLKIEPRIQNSPAAQRALAAAGYRRTFRITPNESTVLVDISGTEDDVFARFSGTCRNMIRRAPKVGLEIRRVDPTDEQCKIMFDLLETTAAGRFELRPYEYYRRFWQTFVAAGKGMLVMGYVDEKPVAGVFGMTLGQTSVYKDGASMRDALPTGTMNALQWELIRWAREQDAQWHDLCGAPPADRVDDATHPLYGVGKYKLAFSKNLVEYVGTFDLPLRRLAYAMWSTLGDRLARRLALKRRNDPYY